MPLAPGAPLPAFHLTAIVSGREVSPATLAGHPAVLVAHGPQSTDAAKEVARVVRERSLDPRNPVLVAVVDLKPFAGVWRKAAEAQMRATYQKLADRVPAGHDPADHILLCPDWDSTVVTALGTDDANKKPTAVVVRPDGTVAGVVSGDGMVQHVVALLGFPPA